LLSITGIGAFPADGARRMSDEMVLDPNVEVLRAVDGSPLPLDLFDMSLNPSPTRGVLFGEDVRRRFPNDEPDDEVCGEVDERLRANAANDPVAGGDGVERGVGKKVGGSASGKGPGRDDNI
jgi:hypothetical protein